MEMWQLYLILKLDALRNLLLWSGLLLFAICLVRGVWKWGLGEVEEVADKVDNDIIPVAMVAMTVKAAFKYCVHTSWQLVLLLISVGMVWLSVLLPGTRDAAILYVVPKLTNSDFVSEKLPADMRDLYDQGLKWFKLKLSDNIPAKKEDADHR